MTSKTYQCIYKELLNCIMRDNALSDLSSKFNKLNTNAERVAECYSRLSYYNLLPDIKVLPSNKSSEVAEKFKTDGNTAFIHNDDNLALYYYNRAITYAPIGSKQLYLSYANRSAVTFSLGDYSDSIKDIDRALSGDYPNYLKHKLLERKGKSFMKLGNFSDAESVFQAALDYLPQSKVESVKLKILSNQLNSLIAECRLSTNRKIGISEENLVHLAHGNNPHIQSGSCALAIEHSPTMGRYIVATTDISPGDVLAIEKPYSSVTLPSSYFSHCFYCQRRCHSLISCLQCSLVCYCDDNCRENSWKDSHCIECSILKSLLQLSCGKMELLSLRVLISASDKGRKLGLLLAALPDLEYFDEPKKRGFSGDIYVSDDYKSIHNLEGNTGLRDVSYLFGRSVIASCILHILDIQTNFFENCVIDIDFNIPSELVDLEEKYGLGWAKIFAGGLLLKYLQSMASNAHEISEMRLMPLSVGNKVESSEIGSAAYPLLSLINHSCDPNVVRHSHNGNTVVLTAIKVIKKGEQIFDNYGFHHATHSKEERHSHLESQYHFVCQCVACCEDWPLYENLPEKNPIYLNESNPEAIEKSSEKYKEILTKLKQGNYQEITRENLTCWLSLLFTHLKLLQENIRRPWQEFSGCQEVIKQCLSFLANHYFYKSSPHSLLELNDKDTGECPF